LPQIFPAALHGVRMCTCGNMGAAWCVGWIDGVKDVIRETACPAARGLLAGAHTRKKLRRPIHV